MKSKPKSVSYEHNPKAFFAARKKRQLRTVYLLLASVGLFIAVVALVRNYNESNLPITLHLERGGSATIAEIEASRSIPRLKELASTVMPRLQKATSEQRQAILNILSAIAEQQLELSRTEEERNQGIRNKLVALQLQANFAEGEEPLPKRLEKLEDFAREHFSNADSEVAFDACQGLLAAEKSRLANATPGDGTVERTGRVVAEVAAKFPKDPRIMAMIEALLERVPRQSDNNGDLDILINAIENTYAANPTEVSKNWLDILRDKQLLIEQDLLNVLPGAEKGNELAVARIVEIADLLLAKHKSFFGVERGVELALLLEASGANREALRLLGNFERVAAPYPKNESAPLIQRIKLGVGRIGLLGQPFPLSGKDLQGNELSLSAYNGKVVCVCFVRKAAEAHRIGKTLSRLSELEKHGVRAVMVVPFGMMNNAQQAGDSFLSIVQCPQGETDLFSECHIDADFCWFLLGKSGKIEKFGVSPELAIISAEKWAFQ